VIQPPPALPQGATAPPPPPPPAPARTEPLGAERYKVQFTADQASYDQLQELRALMRHQIPDGDVGKILGKAISVLLAQVRKQKFAETSYARPAKRGERPSRHIPAEVRRAISKRDGARCTYVSSSGRRCDSREFLEFDHADAWTWTKSHSIAGISLRCRAHNQLRARRDFGEQHMAKFERRTGFESRSP
jgi:hypothetical protein